MALAKKAVIPSETETPLFGATIQQALSSLALEGIDLPVESLRDIQTSPQNPHAQSNVPFD